MCLPMLGFWFITADKKIYLITAANREAANNKWNAMHPGLSYALTTPAPKCSHCARFKPPVGGYIDGGKYMDAQPCTEEEHTEQINAIGDTHLQWDAALQAAR